MPGNTSPDPSFSSTAAASTSSARFDSGTRCSRFAFMRSASTVHVAPSRSISSQLALRTSPERDAVSIRNSSASFDDSLARAAPRTFAIRSEILDTDI